VTVGSLQWPFVFASVVCEIFGISSTHSGFLWGGTKQVMWYGLRATVQKSDVGGVSMLCRSRRRCRRHSVVDAGDDWTDIDDDVVRYVLIIPPLSTNQANSASYLQWDGK